VNVARSEMVEAVNAAFESRLAQIRGEGGR
jgi:hypothetical protein